MVASEFPLPGIRSLDFQLFRLQTLKWCSITEHFLQITLEPRGTVTPVSDPQSRPNSALNIS